MPTLHPVSSELYNAPPRHVAEHSMVALVFVLTVVAIVATALVLLLRRRFTPDPKRIPGTYQPRPFKVRALPRAIALLRPR